jgi:hypothetical protein
MRRVITATIFSLASVTSTTSADEDSSCRVPSKNDVAYFKKGILASFQIVRFCPSSFWSLPKRGGDRPWDSFSGFAMFQGNVTVRGIIHFQDVDAGASVKFEPDNGNGVQLDIWDSLDGIVVVPVKLRKAECWRVPATVKIDKIAVDNIDSDADGISINKYKISHVGKVIHCK